ncbi:SIMPL domain-containing protein [Aliifodinibius sp. 1BSP15-2V2]|uniref:SIMPL domain-containing protein n=1 Tax=Fodinibius salsisoli TaxID=2820877 RepID=A0ABT3PR68_9BACT|nr:SIMPL domain-containing protein [Fodinibius salsisoli]
MNSSATVEVPADQIAFNIDINAEASTPQQAYSMHKKREQVLLDLLKKHNIEEANIDFEPIGISRVNLRHEEQEEVIRTSQSVTLTFSEFDKYEEIQLTLIENDYDNFSGNFMSSKMEEGKDEALKQALQTAREKAEIIARESGLTLTDIQNINFSYHQRPPRPMDLMASYAKAESGSLVSEYDQAVSVSAQISVNYGFTAD